MIMYCLLLCKHYILVLNHFLYVIIICMFFVTVLWVKCLWQVCLDYCVLRWINTFFAVMKLILLLYSEDVFSSGKLMQWLTVWKQKTKSKFVVSFMSRTAPSKSHALSLVYIFLLTDWLRLIFLRRGRTLLLPYSPHSSRNNVYYTEWRKSSTI